MTTEPDDFRRRAIRAALVVAGIAAAIGLIIGGLTSAAVNLTGVLPEPTSTPTPGSEETEEKDDPLPSPSLTTTPTPSAAPSPTPSPTPSATPSETPSASPSPSPSESRKPKPDSPIELRAGTDTAGSFEQVTLSGTYRGGNGTSLQVQRFEGGGWASFPTSATVDGGTFSTYVQLGQPGPNRLRVLDPTTGRTSNVVTVIVS